MNVKSIATVDRKFVEYDYEEQRFLSLTSAFTGGIVTIPAFTRCYFGANQTLKGKRIVGISINASNLAVVYNGATLISDTGLPLFALTMISKGGDEAVNHYPLRDLHRVGNVGKTRIFNIIPDMEQCYVQAMVAVPVAGNPSGILFNFFTVDW